MGSNNNGELDRSEKTIKPETHSSMLGADKPLIESSFGKPGDTFASSILRASASPSMRSDLATKGGLDVPSLCSGSGSTSNLFAEGAAKGALDKPKSIMFSEQTEKQLNILPGLSISFPKGDGSEKTAPREAPKSAELERAKAEVDSPDFRHQSGPASIRNNNPGAMYPGESAKRFGSTHTNRIGGGHLIAEFPDAVSGAAAQFDLLDSSHYRNMSVGAAIGKWCGHNDASHYREFLKHSGIDLKASVGEIMQDKDKAMALAKTMARVEAGKEYPLTKEQWGAAFDKYKEHPSAPVKPEGDGSVSHEGERHRRHHAEHHGESSYHHARHQYSAHRPVSHHRHHHRWE